MEWKPGQRDLLRQRRLLIVEDNPGDRFLYKQMLVEADPGTQYHFDEVETGAQALQRLAEQEADCILLDYLLPDMLGTELLATLTALAAHQEVVPPVVMLTGFGDEATAVSALQNGAHGYIPKRDLTGETLSRAIDRAVRASGSQRKLEQSRLEMAERNRELEQKYQQIESFYRKILGRLQSPASLLRDHLAALEGAQEQRQFALEIKKLRAESEQLVLALGNLIDNPGTNLGQLLISTNSASIIEVISDAVNAFRPAADAAGSRLSVQVQAGLPEVQIDRYRIEQVLSNLLDNAVRHTPQGGHISVKVNRLPATPQEITIAVSDTGTGIPADRLAGLFERRPLQAMAADGGSLGCGLFLCNEILRAHKGRISVESQPGAGTCITFTLPLERGPTHASEVWEQTAYRNGGSLHGRKGDHAASRPRAA